MLTLRIKELCREKGITLNDLAAKIGVSQPSISGMSTGRIKPSFETLEKLSTALDVPVGVLFERRGDFIAFVRRNGETLTFETERALKAFADTLPADTDTPE